MKIGIELSAIALISIVSITAAYGTEAAPRTTPYNSTMSEELDDVIMPRYNDHIEILNGFVDSCSLNSANSATNALEECYTVMKEFNNNMDELRQTYNQTIEYHYNNSLEGSSMSSVLRGLDN